MAGDDEVDTRSHGADHLFAGIILVIYVEGPVILKPVLKRPAERLNFTDAREPGGQPVPNIPGCAERFIVGISGRATGLIFLFSRE